MNKSEKITAVLEKSMSEIYSDEHPLESTGCLTVYHAFLNDWNACERNVDEIPRILNSMYGFQKMAKEMEIMPTPVKTGIDSAVAELSALCDGVLADFDWKEIKDLQVARLSSLIDGSN